MMRINGQPRLIPEHSLESDKPADLFKNPDYLNIKNSIPPINSLDSCGRPNGSESGKCLAENNSLKVPAKQNEFSARQKSKKVKPPIYRAAEIGNIQKLRSSLEKGANPNQPCTGQRYLWPLVAACVFNKTECARVLLENGANPNVVDDDGRTSLFYTVLSWKEKPELCKLLLDYGASIYTPYSSISTIAQRFEDYEESGTSSVNYKIISEIINQHRLPEYKE